LQAASASATTDTLADGTSSCRPLAASAAVTSSQGAGHANALPGARRRHSRGRPVGAVDSAAGFVCQRTKSTILTGGRATHCITIRRPRLPPARRPGQCPRCWRHRHSHHVVTFPTSPSTAQHPRTWSPALQWSNRSAFAQPACSSALASSGSRSKEPVE
jgi:hypothetical protein